MFLLHTLEAFFGLLFLAFIVGTTCRIVYYTRKAVAAGKRATPLSNIKTDAPKRVLVIGDSTSYGTGAEKPENSLVGRLIRDFPDFTIINASENAMNIARMEQKLSTMTTEKFDVVMLHVGGVDTLSFTRSHTIVSSLKKICTYTALMGAHTVALISMNNVGTLPLAHFPLTQIYNTRSKRITNLFAQTCFECEVVHVPLYTEKKDEPLLQNGKSHFSNDKMHPNDDGYGIWYQKIKVALTPHLHA